MKTIFKYSFLTLVSILLLTSCNPDDFLGIKPRGKDVPKDFEHFEGLLNSFDMMRWAAGSGTSIFFPLLSDEYTVTETSIDEVAYNLGQQGKDCYKYNCDFLLEDDMPADWGYDKKMYTLNVIISDVMNSVNGTDVEKESVLSEARVLRSWILFRIAQIYLQPYDESTAADTEGLPIISEANTVQDYFERASMKQLFDFITSEMEESCPNILNETCYIYRVEKADAYTMLGSVYFYMGKYDKALEALRIAKASADESGAAKFYDLNTMSDSEISYDGVYHYNNIENMRNLWANNSCVTFYFPSFPFMGSVYAKPKYFSLYSSSDRRQYRFILEAGFQRVCKSDVPMGITSSDLYLFLAECEARVGDLNSAKTLLKELRKNRMPLSDASVPSSIDTKEELVRFSVEEIIRENLGNGLFFFQMKRLWNDSAFSDLKIDYIHKIEGTSESFPFTESQLEVKIPKSVLNWNTNWE